MPKYLCEFSYTEEGLKGLLKEGGTKRYQAVEAFVKSFGGKLEAFYFAFGDYDGIGIVDGESNINMAAGSFMLNVSGAVKVKTRVLLTPAEIDEAVKLPSTYRAPGK